MGDDAILHQLNSRLIRPILLGDTNWVAGKVVAKRRQGEHYFADLELQAINQLGEVTMPVSATVALPSKEGGPVRIPIPC
ncbi:MAG: acyl dehydratase, partial [Chloroflexi bacterium]|nr:acyl dehydratase [Chloroflexota bacterium]